MNIQEITPDQVLEAVKNGSIFIDVRETWEVDEAGYDIPGRLEIPMGEVPNRLSEIPKEKNIIVGCRSGARSMNICQFLASQGYNNIKNMQGGIMGWMNHGLPTV